MRYIRKLINEYELLVIDNYSKAAESLAQGLIDIDLKIHRFDQKDKCEQRNCFYRLFNIINDYAELSHNPIKLLLAALSTKLLDSRDNFQADPYDTFDEKAELLSNQIPKLISEVLSIWEHSDPEDLKFRLATIILFSATSGGLSNLPSMVALLHQLQTESKFLKKLDNDFFIELRFQDKCHETNAFSVQGEHLETLRRWYPDEISLAAIIGFEKLGKNNGNTNYLLPGLLKYMLNKVNLHSDVGTPSPTLFLKACALYLQRNECCTVDTSLKNYANGELSSASMSLKSLYALHNLSVNSKTDFDKFKNSSKELAENKKKQLNHTDKFNGTFSIEEFYIDLCVACKKHNKHGHIRSQKEARQQLAQVRVKYESMPPAAEVLLDWLSSKLESKDWCNNSATRNLHAIGKGFLEVVGTDQLDDADGADMQILFELIGEKRFQEDSESYRALVQLLLHAHVKFQIALPDEMIAGPISVTHVRSELVSELNFQRLREEMQTIYKSSSTLICHSVDIILILANRLFMRPSEILRLRVRDIEISKMSWITVRPSIWSILKTASAKRKLPTKLLILPQEFDLFLQFIKKRRHQTEDRPNALLFSQLVDSDIPISLAQISNNIGSLLSSYQGEPTRFYALRHTGISSLQLMLLGSQRLHSRYLAHNAQQITTIKTFLCCNDTDKYFQIAALAGHLTPRITLSTYAHFTDLLLYESIFFQTYNLTLNVWRKILKARPSTLRKAIGSEDRDNAIIPTPSDFIFTQAKALCNHDLSLQQVMHKPEMATIVSPDNDLESIYQILKLYDKHDSVSEVSWRLDYDEKWIAAVINTAKKIKEHYKTSRGKPRLFPGQFEGICPIQPTSNIEKLDAEKIIRRLESDKARCKSLKPAIHHVFDTISQDHPEISFSNPTHLKSFMNTLNGVISSGRWHASLKPTTDNIDACFAMWNKTLASEIRICSDRKKNKKLFPHGQLSIQYLRVDSLKVIKEFKSTVKFNKYGSNALKWVMHLVAIYLGATSLIDN